jgi:hypothetical protein
MKPAQLEKAASAILEHVQASKAKAGSTLLPDALDIQRLARELRTLRDAGQSGSEVFETLLDGFVSRRRALVSTPITTPVDALVVAHAMESAIHAVDVCADSENPDTFRFLALELSLALQNLIPFIENKAGVTRGQLDLDQTFTPETIH